MYAIVPSIELHENGYACSLNMVELVNMETKQPLLKGDRRNLEEIERLVKYANQGTKAVLCKMG